MISEDNRIIELLKSEASLQEAFSLIVKSYSERLYWQVRKIVMSHDDANDILQNTFIKVWSNLKSFRGDSKLITWLYRIATNEAFTFLNKQKTQYMIPLDDSENILVEKLESDSYFDGDEAQLKLQKAILTLPDKQRTVFNMRYFDEMKYEDIAEVLGTSVGALKASYHHAAKKIEELLTSSD